MYKIKCSTHSVPSGFAVSVICFPESLAPRLRNHSADNTAMGTVTGQHKSVRMLRARHSFVMARTKKTQTDSLLTLNNHTREATENALNIHFTLITLRSRHHHHLGDEVSATNQRDRNQTV